MGGEASESARRGQGAGLTDRGCVIPFQPLSFGRRQNPSWGTGAFKMTRGHTRDEPA